VRIQKNPSYYKIQNCTANEGRLTAEARLEAICDKDIDLLQATKLIQANAESLESTEEGRVMAKLYIKFSTMESLMREFWFNMEQTVVQKLIISFLLYLTQMNSSRFVFVPTRAISTRSTSIPTFGFHSRPK
jgi:hypothetical protein